MFLEILVASAQACIFTLPTEIFIRLVLDRDHQLPAHGERALEEVRQLVNGAGYGQPARTSAGAPPLKRQDTSRFSIIPASSCSRL